jgi:hypothetical protein
MSRQDIQLVFTAKDMASKVLAGLNGNVGGIAGTLRSIRGLNIASVFIQAGMAIWKMIEGVRQWKKEYINAVAQAAQVEMQFRRELITAGKQDRGIIARGGAADIRLAEEKNSTNAAITAARIEQQLLEQKHAEEMAAHDEKLAALKEEEKALTSVLAVEDAAMQKYDGLVGAAQLAFDRARAFATDTDLALSLAAPEEQARSADIKAEAARKVEEASVALVAAKTEAEKKRQETLGKIGVLQEKQRTAEQDAANLTIAQQKEIELQGIETARKVGEASVEQLREQAKGYKEDAEKNARAAKIIAEIRGGRKAGTLTSAEMEDLGAVGGLGFEGETKSRDRELARKERLNAQAVARAQKAQEAGLRLTPAMRRALAMDAAGKGAVQFANDAARVQAEADRLMRDIGKSTKESADFLRDIKTDLRENLRGI